MVDDRWTTTSIIHRSSTIAFPRSQTLGAAMSSAFHFEERGDGIGLLTLDLPDKKVNTLSQATLMELGGVLAQLKGRTDLRGLLLRSGKPGQFIAGADLNEIGALAFANKEQVGQAVAMGHKLYGMVS